MSRRNKIAIVLVLLLAVAGEARAETKIRGERMDYSQQSDRVMFTGKVRLDHAPDVVRADQMITNSARDFVTAVGHVDMLRQASATETYKAAGQEAYYHAQKGEGNIKGTDKKQARIVYSAVLSSTMTRVVTVDADRVDFSRNTSEAVATGRVYGETHDPVTQDVYRFWSDKAVFNNKQKQITLTGGTPARVIRTNQGKDSTVTGQRVVYWTDTQRIMSEGEAVAVFRSDPSAGRKKP